MAEGRTALGLQAGTLGFGATAQIKLNTYLVAHADASVFNFDKTVSSDDMDYDGSLKLNSFSVAADLHPFANGFFVSAGVATGKKDVGLKGTPTSDQEIGDDVYTPAEIGTISGQISFPKSSTIIGLGYDRTFYSDSAVHIRLFLGAQLSGSPKVSLTSNGTLASDPDYQANLAQEESDLRDDVSDFKAWPVAQLSLTYRF